jgi:hypothetical protein
MKRSLAVLTRVWIDRNRPALRAAINAAPKRLTKVHTAAPATARSIGGKVLKNKR